LKRNETYYLTNETIKMVKDFADEHFGNKSKVIEAAVKEFIEKRKGVK
jgi:hypothetical protein